LYRPEVEVTVVRNIDYGFFDISRRALRFVNSVVPTGEKLVGWLDAWKDASREVAVSRAEAGLDRHSVIKGVWDATEAEDALVLGASRLIRDAENWAPRKNLRVFANRGLAGIDGTIATALGVAAVSPAESTTRVLLGDLAFLHDVGSLVSGETEPNLQVVVVNDHGGSIFESLELTKHVEQPDYERFFAAGQTFDVSALATAFGWQYLSPSSEAELLIALGTTGRVIIEIVPN
jgi:2-succinyl-5-enolpyruvyl-6-hydroxy-3-cyclohexene-1-carboxylate synthase